MTPSLIFKKLLITILNKRSINAIITSFIRNIVEDM